MDGDFFFEAGDLEALVLDLEDFGDFDTFAFFDFGVLYERGDFETALSFLRGRPGPLFRFVELLFPSIFPLFNFW